MEWRERYDVAPEHHIWDGGASVSVGDLFSDRLCNVSEVLKLSRDRYGRDIVKRNMSVDVSHEQEGYT
jgi:hypothetical protein